MALFDLLIAAILLLLVLIAPPLIGLSYGRKSAAPKWYVASLVGGLLAASPFAGFAIWIASTSDMRQVPECQPPECSMASVYVTGLIAIAVIAFIVGALLGWGGYRGGRTMREEGGEAEERAG